MRLFGRKADAASSWFGADGLLTDSPDVMAEARDAFARLWHGFMTARVMIALMLLVMQASAYLMGQGASFLVLDVCTLYLVATLAVRMLGRPRQPGQTFDRQWVTTIAVDVIAFSALQFFQGGSVNYTALFAMPVLLAAVLGSLALALGTTSAVTLLLLADAWWGSLQAPAELAARFLQAGLAGTGLFIVAFLTHQLASRLSQEEEVAQRSAREARVQTRVNELVIENLTDGILVIDRNHVVRAANPAARVLLDWTDGAAHLPFTLDSRPGWQPLTRLADMTFALGDAQNADVDLQQASLAHWSLKARTRLAASLAEGAESLCVMFLQDRREMEARLRTEKLAAMGRMSAAVAHEIRNPLSAITQANALLDEDLGDPAHKRLTLMVRHNAERLARIVDEILDVARVEHLGSGVSGTRVQLDAAVQAMSDEWLKQSGDPGSLRVALATENVRAVFDTDHLRRLLVNLLDNAQRYASHAAPIHVSTALDAGGAPELKIWSDGPPLEPTVQRHLFEPFFSSQSRSSGLGLYICRELCERNGAQIGYQRSQRNAGDTGIWGNEFSVRFNTARIPGQVDTELQTLKSRT